MKFETVKTTKQFEVEEILVRYSQEDIEQLIRKDLQEQGYKTKSITFITDSKYKSDEWGMNNYLSTYLKGVNVIVY